MSRRSAGQPTSSEDVFAQRNRETPYQIYFEISNIGRNVESSKKRARWKFCFGDEGREHEVTLVHSLMSGKKRTFFNGEMINEAQKVSKEWSFAWSFGAHLLRVGINFEEYSLVIDGIPYKNFHRRDPFLAAQLEATKRDSLRSLQTDEQRRFERLGYSGSSGSSQGVRSRTAERRRSGPNGDRTGAGSRAVSTGRTGSRDRESVNSSRGGLSDGVGPQRRSSSIERTSSSRNGEGRSGPLSRNSSGRQQVPPAPSGPGSRSKSNPRGSKSRSPPVNSRAVGSNAAPAPRAPDILSADPSTLEVRGFNTNLPESSFDPLASRRASAAAAAAAAPEGGGSGSGGTGNPWGSGGFGAQGSGFATGPRGSSEDAAAILQLGMQFEAMGMNSQAHQQPPPQQHQRQQQQQQHGFFDHGGYQQYDEAGFPIPTSTQGYNAPQQQQQHPQQTSGGGFGDSSQQGFGFGETNGGIDFSGGYGGHGQDQGQPPAQQEHQDFTQGRDAHSDAPTASSTGHAADAKAAPDPWDMARAGMVNIDDITDTKNKPMVEVKPFTDDHRPLADLVREAPVKERKPVMIERPEPAPTHMAVAIVPFQAPGQQQMAFGQQGYPKAFGTQQQNGNNPFAQPILYTKPNDPFFNL